MFTIVSGKSQPRGFFAPLRSLVNVEQSDIIYNFSLAFLQTSGGSDTSSDHRAAFISAGGGGPQTLNEKDALFGLWQRYCSLAFASLCQSMRILISCQYLMD